jgi:hypothetical protein
MWGFLLPLLQVFVGFFIFRPTATPEQRRRTKKRRRFRTIFRVLVLARSLPARFYPALSRSSCVEMEFRIDTESTK